MKKIIIGFSGSCATGKTTIANMLKEKYPKKIALKRESARQIAEELGYTSIKAIPQERFENFQKFILNDHIKMLNEFKLSEDGSFLICDSTLFEIATYILLNAKLFKYSLFQKIRMYAYNNPYTSLFHFPLIDLDEEHMKDGFRNLELRNYADLVLNFLYRDGNVSHVKVPEDLDVRFKFFEDYLSLG